MSWSSLLFQSEHVAYASGGHLHTLVLKKKPNNVWTISTCMIVVQLFCFLNSYHGDSKLDIEGFLHGGSSLQGPKGFVVLLYHRHSFQQYRLDTPAWNQY